MGFRPNALPSKQHTIGQRVQEKVVSEKFRVNGKRRTVISDLCDFCLKFIKVHRHFMSLRLKGYKFICYKCTREKKLDLSVDLKRLKLVVEFLPPIKKEE